MEASQQRLQEQTDHYGECSKRGQLGSLSSLNPPYTSFQGSRSGQSDLKSAPSLPHGMATSKKTITRTRKCSLTMNPRHHLTCFTHLITLAVVLTVLILASHLFILQAECAVGETCDFSRYPSGCYRNANLECDIVTERCKCMPNCVQVGGLCYPERGPRNQCFVSEQCSHYPGLHCRFNHENTSCVNSSSCHCDFINPEDAKLYLKGELPSDNDDHRNNKDPHELTKNHHQLNSHGNRARTTQLIKSHSSNTWENESDIIRQSSTSNHSGNAPSNLLTRLIWLFLLLSLVSLILLLLVIKYHSPFTCERPFQLGDDRISISSEPDVPPPYEVAIRMKV